MSKKDLKKYLSELNKTQLEEQIVELYDKFKEVKVFYDFAFNPNEKALIKDAKIKISNEYFPITSRRAKLRRSTAQKFIKHYITLGVDVFIVADIMLYSIEIAQVYTKGKVAKSEAFYKSLRVAFEQVVSFLIANAILSDFESRVVAIKNETLQQRWINHADFEAIVERFQY
jgi:putative NIF3 family GTP cyclohydrolase 1 type 2